jgi:hypothetical protein
MAETDNQSVPAPRFDPSRDPLKTIFDSALEAFGSAFVVWIMGGIAFSIAGGFAGGMVPSLPPGFGGPPSGPHHGWWRVVRGDAFGVFFAIFFVHSLWVAFHGRESGPGKRLERILSHLREHWFSLIVGNAISAWVAILVLRTVPNFSPIQMLWHWAWGMGVPIIREIATFLLGASTAATLGDWFSWYGANQMKLDFWLIYIAGAFDDLGVPNFKTLARWAWRRMRKRNSPAAIVPG